MKIYQLTHIDQKVVDVFAKLIPQLNDSIRPPSQEELEELIASGTSFLFVAEEQKEIIGTLTIGTYRIPTGVKAWIEDVIVDENARGKGVGKQLTAHAIEFAKSRGWKKLELTSRPSRVAANELYRKLGFELRETNMYRLELG